LKVSSGSCNEMWYRLAIIVAHEMLALCEKRGLYTTCGLKWRLVELVVY